MDKQPHEPYSYFDYLANLTRDWATTESQNPKNRLNTQGVNYQLKEVNDVNGRLATMIRKLEALEFNKVNSMGSEELKEVSCVCVRPKNVTPCRALSFRVLRRLCMAKSTLLANTTEERETPVRFWLMLHSPIG